MEKVPEHIAIILDGNRRYAKSLALKSWKGQSKGAETVEKLFKYSADLKIKELTLYCLSSENIKNRPKMELNYLYKIFEETFQRKNQENTNGIKFKFIGDLNLIPNKLKKLSEELEEKTKNEKQLTVNLAIGYGGRQEIIKAITNIVKAKVSLKNINEKLISSQMDLQTEPDLIIRTGGEKRTSNFLPWQSIYSEWIFLDKKWPEFTKQDLIKCIKEYNKRKRNHGK